MVEIGDKVKLTGGLVGLSYGNLVVKKGAEIEVTPANIARVRLFVSEGKLAVVDEGAQIEKEPEELDYEDYDD